jgi:hypothetical protein
MGAMAIGIWTVDDGFGSVLANGLTERDAPAVAQELADRFDMMVFLYAEGDAEMMTVTPSDPKQVDDPADVAACTAEIRAEMRADERRELGDD